jgi:uncharacterized membrane protein
MKGAGLYVCSEAVIVIPMMLIFLGLVKKCKYKINESNNESDMDVRVILKWSSVRDQNKTYIPPNSF